MTAKQTFQKFLLLCAFWGGVLLLLPFTFSACTNREAAEDAVMEAILRDLFMAQCIVDQNESLRQCQADSALEVYAPVLASHGYTQSKLDSMLTVYSLQPARLDAILDRVVASIEEERERLAKLDAQDMEQKFLWQAGWGWLKKLNIEGYETVCREPSDYQYRGADSQRGDYR